MDSKLKLLHKTKLLEALKASNGSRTKAAEILGINPRTVRYRMVSWKIEYPCKMGRPKSG